MNSLRGGRLLGLGAVMMALVALPAAVGGTPWSWTWLVAGVPLGFRLDLVSVLLLGFVGLLGWVVADYSLTNLRGRREPERAGVALTVALASLLVTVSGSSLVVMAVGWTASGLAFAALVARSGTPRARAAAGVMRRTLLVGDAFLWCGVLAGLWLLPSLERARLDEVEAGWATTVVALLLLGACVARTGLVPAHRWLPETAEAPSPVSALLHAGVVNGAGVLVVLAWPLFSAAPLALAGLLLFGALSLVMGAWASRVRSDVKGRLACSTTAQMGYMCIQLGLGLPAAALMHLVGHGAYKSWLFLRAGGSLGRNRALVEPRPGGSPRRWGAGALAVAVAGLIGLPATAQLVEASGLTAVVPVGLSLLAAGLAGHAVAGLGRVSPTVEWTVGSLAGLVAGSYAWGLLAAEQVLRVALPPEPIWTSAVGAGLVVALAGTALLLAVGYRHLVANPDSALVMSLLPTALTPTRRPRPARSVTHLSTELGAHPGAIAKSTIVAAVNSAGKVVGPAWPLRNMVAANPLAGLESLAFDDALLVAHTAHGVTGRASLPYFLDLFDSGRITPDHLGAALDETLADGVLEVERDDVAGFVRTSHGLAVMGRPVVPASSRARSARLCEALPAEHATRVTAMVDEHSALWAQRAWASTGLLYGASLDAGIDAGIDPGPWTRWRQAAALPSYDRGCGIRGASAMVRTLPADPAEAVSMLAGWADMPVDELVGYLIATLASAPGWAGHARWRARRQQDPTPLVEWAALRMAHDVLFSQAYTDLDWGPAKAASRSLSNGLDPLEEEILQGYTGVWQRALEIGIEDWLLGEVAPRAAATTTAGRPASQSIWCIDVRSERVRRHLESLGNHHTYGYAGFFGAAVRHLDADQVSHECCPALIEPTFTAHAHTASLSLRQAIHRTTTSVSSNPLGALVIAEAGGAFAAFASTLTTVLPRAMRRLARSWTQDRPQSGAGHRPPLATNLTLDDRVALAVGALRTTGLVDGFAPVILICAHGSTPENNAFASAYDCGACGGNDGLVNATLLVDALNDTAVREQMAAQGIVVPADTVAVAALHDTTTDRVYVRCDDQSAILDQTRKRLLEVVTDLETAGLRAADQQRSLLPARNTRATRSLARRAADWSEPTPEWGLAGNASIFFGPRRLTAGNDLRGRVFLHSYERDTDPEGAILEQLLTAPLVVAQWINAQYYFSAIAPNILGAGDKTTHNVVGDVGVLQGAHGDLATGLPWQALFRHQPGTRPDSVSLAHEPVRLLATVVADRDHVMQIVRRHDVLCQLIGNRWIHLVCLDDDRTLRLHHDLTWRDWKAPSSTRPTPAVRPEQSERPGVARVSALEAE